MPHAIGHWGVAPVGSCVPQQGVPHHVFRRSLLSAPVSFSKAIPRVSAHLCMPAILPARMRHLRSRAALLGGQHGVSAILVRRLGVMGRLELAVAAGWWECNGKGLCMRGAECCSNNLGARRSSRRNTHVTSRASPQLCSGQDDGKPPAICLRGAECICIKGNMNKRRARLGTLVSWC